MTVAGDKSIFAIEWEKTHRIGNAEYSKFCFWLSNMEVGDYNNEVNLNTVISRIKEFIIYKNDRIIGRLSGKKKEDVFSTIYCSVYGQEHAIEGISNNLIYEIDHNRIAEFREKFVIVDMGEASFIDTMAGVIIEDDILHVQRIIWKNFNESGLHETLLPLGYFEMICNEFICNAR